LLQYINFLRVIEPEAIRGHLGWCCADCLLIGLLVSDLVDRILDKGRVVVELGRFLEINDLAHERILRERLAIGLRRRPLHLSRFLRAFELCPKSVVVNSGVLTLAEVNHN